jgi:hypothetical protein
MRITVVGAVIIVAMIVITVLAIRALTQEGDPGQSNAGD